MIQSNPIPEMSAEDVKVFRRVLCEYMSSKNTPEAIRRRAEMSEISKQITKNSGGINPILGY